MADGNVGYEVRGQAAWITLDRPDKLNAFAGDMREQFLAHVERAAEDPEVRAVVVTGNGRAFCAGGDVDTMVKLHRDADESGFRKLLDAGGRAMLALQSYPGLTVAAVNGVAAGAGLSLALSCDLRLAAPTAKFAASWIRLGLIPDWGATFWLPRMVGSGRALEMVLTGNPVEADEALRIGLVTEIVDAEEFRGSVAQRVAEMGAAGFAVGHAKRLLRLGAEQSFEAALLHEAKAQEACFGSADFEEGLQAFLAKRAARNEGE